jgi:ABC-type transporter Mla subunit MlaD
LLLTVRQGIERLNSIVSQFASDTRPLIGKANDVVGDARAVVALLRADVERVSDAANVVGDQLLAAADSTARRVDEVNAVLDVLQGEMEATAISAAAAVRGVRVGARALSGRPRRRRGHDDSPEG